MDAVFDKNVIRLSGEPVDPSSFEESLGYYYFICSVSLFICMIILIKSSCQWCCLLCNWNREHEGVQSNLEVVTINIVNRDCTYGAINESQMSPLRKQNDVLGTGKN